MHDHCRVTVPDCDGRDVPTILLAPPCHATAPGPGPERRRDPGPASSAPPQAAFRGTFSATVTSTQPCRAASFATCRRVPEARGCGLSRCHGGPSQRARAQTYARLRLTPVTTTVADCQCRRRPSLIIKDNHFIAEHSGSSDHRGSSSCASRIIIAAARLPGPGLRPVQKRINPAPGPPGPGPGLRPGPASARRSCCPSALAARWRGPGVARYLKHRMAQAHRDVGRWQLETAASVTVRAARGKTEARAPCPTG